ncbi:hypothetical protein ACJ73_04405 [Blastomyces percursus]|uniref:Uncharacterized protein n=1 Tax=Blastomyces percursus TaxID=1658174 RepID=A0A1J9R994_9EURO|nr:hypothetical protein ACJ73_04405 [Blastomyces percursus]
MSSKAGNVEISSYQAVLRGKADWDDWFRVFESNAKGSGVWEEVDPDGGPQSQVAAVAPPQAAANPNP